MSGAEKTWVWVGVDLPGRDADGTYGSWPYETLPPLDAARNPYHMVRTLSDLSSNKGILPQNSPTACYFSVNHETGTFYHDQQDCVIWALDNQGVFLYEDRPEPEEDEEADEPEEDKQQRPPQRAYVAHSLPEFLWRVSIEERLWFYCKQDQPNTVQTLLSGQLVGPLPGLEPGSVEDLYLRHYPNIQQRTRQYYNSTGCTRTDQWFSSVYALKSATCLEANNIFGSQSFVRAVDALCPSLKWKSTWFGPPQLEPISQSQVLSFVQTANTTGRAAALAWLKVAAVRGMEKNLAKLIGKMIFESRFDSAVSPAEKRT